MIRSCSSDLRGRICNCTLLVLGGICSLTAIRGNRRRSRAQTLKLFQIKRIGIAEWVSSLCRLMNRPAHTLDSSVGLTVLSRTTKARARPSLPSTPTLSLHLLLYPERGAGFSRLCFWRRWDTALRRRRRGCSFHGGRNEIFLFTSLFAFFEILVERLSYWRHMTCSPCASGRTRWAYGRRGWRRRHCCGYQESTRLLVDQKIFWLAYSQWRSL